MEKPIKITIFLWAGEKWFLRIRSECAECHMSVAVAKKLVADHPEWPMELDTKPWLTHIGESLRHGGWHAPVVMVDGRIVRQGTVPTLAELENAVRRALASHRVQTAQRESDATEDSGIACVS